MRRTERCQVTGKVTSWLAPGTPTSPTLVERQSRFVMLVKVDAKDTETVVRALSRHVRSLPGQLRSTVTWDRGMELAAHKDFTVATGVAVYFCDPQSPWQRGTNENMNGLLRQYFPKNTDLSAYSQRDLDLVAARLNTRPRKTLGYIEHLPLLSPQPLQRPVERTWPHPKGHGGLRPNAYSANPGR